MRIRSATLSLVFLLLVAPTHAQLFQIGTAGTAAGVNNWPAAESPDHAIDGVGQKYLNFGRLNTGIAVSPAAGAGAPISIEVWTANDAVERDPLSFTIYGTNAAASGAPNAIIGGLTEIATGALALPATRNAGGAAVLDPANLASASFANAATFPTYVIVFPTIKDAPAAANSMQIAEVQLRAATGAPIFAPGDAIVGGQLIPEPSTAIMGGLGLALAALRMRRRG